MRVVLDSNILLSALLSPVGTPARIYSAWQDGHFVLVTCKEQLDEIRRVSRYPKLRALLRPHVVGTMMNSMRGAHFHRIRHHNHEAIDFADAYLLDLAAEADCDYLVTGDKRAGLLEQRTIARARIVTAASFSELVIV